MTPAGQSHTVEAVAAAMYEANVEGRKFYVGPNGLLPVPWFAQTWWEQEQWRDRARRVLAEVAERVS